MIVVAVPPVCFSAVAVAGIPVVLEEAHSSVGNNCGSYGRVEVQLIDRLCREDVRESKESIICFGMLDV